MPSTAAELVSLTQIPKTDEACRKGFRFDATGTHSSRTFMLSELAHVLDKTPVNSRWTSYRAAVIDENLAEKRTAATRRITCQRLRELYALDPGVAVFQGLRSFWTADKPGQPLLALLCAISRDPLLRATAPAVLALQEGEELSRQQLISAIKNEVGNRLNENVIDKVVRNAASTWTQAGHLQGRVRKLRRRVSATPMSVAYALLLGYWLGLRGGRLFNTLWTRVLDTSFDELLRLATEAKRLGVLDLKREREVIEITFAPLLLSPTLRVHHGPD